MLVSCNFEISAKLTSPSELTSYKFSLRAINVIREAKLFLLVYQGLNVGFL